MHIWLLTHSEELKKANGTGAVVLETYAKHCTRLIWERTQPAIELVNLPLHSTYLIYPQSDQEQTVAQDLTCPQGKIENLIILDGTWQQARKMYNRSSYLHTFPKYEINGETSIFKRRKNQVEGGLCTAETAAHLLKVFGEQDAGERIYQAFLSFNEKLLNHSQ